MLSLLEIGQEIAKRRKSLALTQTELAERAGISRPSIAGLENGRSGELGYTKVAKILSVLGLTLKLQESIGRRPTLDDLRQEERNAQGLDGRL